MRVIKSCAPLVFFATFAFVIGCFRTGWFCLGMATMRAVAIITEELK